MTRKLFAEYCICVFAVFDEEKQRERREKRKMVKRKRGSRKNGLMSNKKAKKGE